MIDAAVPESAGKCPPFGVRGPSVTQRPFSLHRLAIEDANARSRYLIVGAWIIAVLAVALAAVAFGPMLAAALRLLPFLLTPALLFWLSWPGSRWIRVVGVLILMLVTTLVINGFAPRVYGQNSSDVQPESTTTLEEPLVVRWIWAGGVTEASAEITASIRQSIADQAPQVRLAVSEREDMSDPRIVEATIDRLTEPAVLRFAVDDLTPDTDYWYAVSLDGALDLARKGHLRTFPVGPASFTFAFGSCALTGSNAVVFDTIREQDPLFFLSLGDFFYGDIAVSDPNRFRDAFTSQLNAPAQNALYRSAPIAYVWDDHDFGPNNSDGTSPSRPAAQAVYRQVVPHYPLPAPDDAAIYQAFTVGRVRFILTDNYSYRSPDDAPDGPDKTLLGDEQQAWLEQELLDANGTYPVIVWGNSQPWIAPAGDDAAGWGAFATERKEIASFIHEHNIRGLMMLSGDAHALAIDNGSNNTYGGLSPGFPVFHAAALDRQGSEKGGPYSNGMYPGGGHFGLVTVHDDGGPMIEIEWSGRNYANEEIVGYRFAVDARDTATPVATPLASQSGPLAMVVPVAAGIRRRKAG
jgi:hypothetical protein